MRRITFNAEELILFKTEQSFNCHYSFIIINRKGCVSGTMKPQGKKNIAEANMLPIKRGKKPSNNKTLKNKQMNKNQPTNHTKFERQNKGIKLLKLSLGTV